MALIKNFLHVNIKSLEISRHRFFAGILIGIGYSFAFYSLFYVIREGLRIMSIVENFDLWILTDQEVNFYNLFFAILSLIIGQSICFTFWIDKPHKIFKKRIYRRNSIVNEQRVLNWYFLNWFAKLALIFSTMFGFSADGGYYVFSLYTDYKYLFILFIVVLYLFTWNTIQLTFKKKSYKWILISALIISISSLLLSRINLIDYKSINSILKKENIYEKYRLNVPESSVYNRFSRSFETNKSIYVVSNDHDPKIIMDGQEIEFGNLYSEVRYLVNVKRHNFRDKYYPLHIHKNVKMGFVNKLRKELSKSNIFHIAYGVTPINPKYDRRYYKNHTFKVRIPDYNYIVNPPLNDKELIVKYPNIIKITQNKTDEFFINDNSIKTDKIKEVIKVLIQQEPNYIIKFYINDNDSFSSYIKIMSLSKAAINDLRKEYYIKEGFKEKKGLFYDAREELATKYPYRIYEITNEIIEILENQRLTN